MINTKDWIYFLSNRNPEIRTKANNYLDFLSLNGLKGDAISAQAFANVIEPALAQRNAQEALRNDYAVLNSLKRLQDRGY